MKIFAYSMGFLIVAIVVLSLLLFSKRDVSTVYVSSRADPSASNYKHGEVMSISSFGAVPPYDILRDDEVFLARYKMKGFLIYCEKIWTVEEAQRIERETGKHPISYEKVNGFDGSGEDKLFILFPCSFD